MISPLNFEWVAVVASTQKTKDSFLFDKRVVQRHVTDGKISRSEVETHLNQLPDLSERCEDISVEIFGELENGKSNH